MLFENVLFVAWGVGNYVGDSDVRDGARQIQKFLDSGDTWSSPAASGVTERSRFKSRLPDFGDA